MNRTEDDLRAVYADPPGISDVERRLLSGISDGDRFPTAPRGRTPSRTWAAPLAGAVAVAAVTVTVAVVTPDLRSHPSNEPAAAAQSSSSIAPTTAATTAPSAGTVAPPVLVTPQVAVQTLLSILPRIGSTAQLSGTRSLGWVGGTLVYDDGHGAAKIAIGLSYPYISTNPDPNVNGKLQRLPVGSLCSSQGVVQLKTPCTTKRDGSQIAVYQGNGNIPGGAKAWEVSVLRTDGVQVDVTEWNSPAEKGRAQTRADPPFTIAELTTMARSSKWRARVSSAVAHQAASLFVVTAMR